ncbi:MAG: ABC transporter permease [Gammaproteobacteria bacterium]
MLRNLNELVAHHELIANFAAREILSKYKQAALGVAWAVLQPLAQLLTMTLVFSYFARVPSEGFPYPLYLFCGLLPWLYFAGSLNRGVSCLLNQRGLITKIYFPRECIVLASLIAAIVDLLFASLVYVALLLYYGHYPSLTWLYAVPIFVVQTMLALGLMLILAPMNAFYRDVGQMMPFLLQLWMYLTPIMYPTTLIPEQYRDWFALNPMVGIVEAYRDAMLRHEAPDPAQIGYSAAVAVTALLVGYLVFKKIELKIADFA